MKNPPSVIAAWIIFGAAILIGCGSAPSPKATSDPAMLRLSMIGGLYLLWSQAHGSTPPANREQLVSFAQKDPAMWSKAAATPEELLTSPRDNQPFVLVLGGAMKDSAETGFPWVAREKTGVDGKVYVADLRGKVMSFDASEIEKSFPASK